MNYQSKNSAQLNFKNQKILKLIMNKFPLPMILPALLSLFLIFLVHQEAHAASMTFTSDTTIASDETISQGEVWTIEENVILTITEGVSVTGDGKITNQGDLVNSGLISMENGNIENSGTIVNTGNGTLDDGVIDNFAGSTLINDGKMADNSFDFTLNNSGTFTNNGNFGSHVQHTLSNDGDVVNNGEIFGGEDGNYDNEGGFINNGIVELNDFREFINTSGTFTNNNQLIISADSTFENNATLINDGNINIITEGLLANTGTITNNGTIFKDCEGLTAGTVPTSGNVVETEQGCAPFIVEMHVTAREDDAEERQFGSVSNGSADLELTKVKNEGEGGNQTVGLRFFGLRIPQGATILNAYVQFTADEKRSESTSLSIEGQASDDAQSFSQTPFNISSRPLTTASVGWSPAPWTVIGEAGSAQRTTDLTPVVQEIVDRPGWSDDFSQALALIITGDGKRTAMSYGDNRQESAPLLHVEYINN